jgi:hypothetical protein
MKGEFSRRTFDPAKHFCRVLQQQGRVQLDADWNELNAILLHYLRVLTVDALGPFWGPGERDFQLVPDGESPGFRVSEGHYYVGGILCENEEPVQYLSQPHLRLDGDDVPDALIDAHVIEGPGTHLIYLDVWEQFVTALQDPEIRERALGGADTTGRARVVWQVKAIRIRGDRDCDGVLGDWRNMEARLRWHPWIENGVEAPEHGRLQATTESDDTTGPTDPCDAASASRYTGTENLLYRVEIHTSGVVGSDRPPTFKWSRDNGSIVFPIRRIDTDVAAGSTTVELEHLGSGGRSGLGTGDWVEVSDDDRALWNVPEALLRVTTIDQHARTVVLEGARESRIGENRERHPLLRRWDHGAGGPALDVAYGSAVATAPHDWLPLENGIAVQFEPGGYLTGDYWLIPARVETGDIEWPRGEWRRPDGVDHHYAPLGILTVDGEGARRVSIRDCRRVLRCETAFDRPGASQA